jgi:hypothetical protein
MRKGLLYCVYLAKKRDEGQNGLLSIIHYDRAKARTEGKAKAGPGGAHGKGRTMNWEIESRQSEGSEVM